MEIKLFSDLIDALSKVASGLKALTDLPLREREKYRQTLGETFRLIDTTLNMVIIRLGDILLLKKDEKLKFMDEVTRLDNYDEWLKAERSFRLCQSLRASISEMESLRRKLPGRVSVQDWDALIQEMESLLQTEAELAAYITSRFWELSESVRDAAPSPKTVRHRVQEFREALIKERQRLIKQEIELYSIV